MILFRADGNSKIGSGHVMRCLSLADAGREAGVDCRFVTAGAEFQEIIQDRGYPCAVLGTDYADMESELPMLTTILSDEKPEAVVVDSYCVTPNYLSTLRPFGKLIYIDDLSAFAYPVDVLVNYGFGAENAGYDALYRGKQAPMMLLGLKYAPLRREFQGLSFKHPAETVKDVFVSTGGADPEHVAVRLIEGLQNRQDMAGYRFHLVIGPMNRDGGQIAALAPMLSNVSIHRNVRNMRELMTSCDVAISAGGSTILELCACGLPIITYSLADNQAGIKKFAEEGFALFAGEARGNESFVASVFDLLNNLCRDYNRRKTMAEKVFHLVDGWGAGRVVEALRPECLDRHDIMKRKL